MLSMVVTLVPGVSTLSQFARYYALYWALAGLAAECDFTERRLPAHATPGRVRLALVSQAFDDRENQAHGVAAVTRSRGAGGRRLGARRGRSRLPTRPGPGASGRSTAARRTPSGR